MIEGLHVDVTGVEMKALYQGRTKHHMAKVEFYKAQSVEVKAMEDRLGVEAKEISKTNNKSALEHMLASVEKHEGLALYFAFAAEHTNTNETYRLSRADLHTLGIAPNVYG